MSKKFDFNDILIEPANTSRIISRKKINPFYDGFLPLITAPMDTVIDSNNENIFHKLNINVCMPRNETTSIGFTSYSIDEMFSKYLTNSLKEDGYYLIDVANGHMENLLEMTRMVKKKFPDLKLMVGNVASPNTYALLSNAGADYVRIGIGNGGGCFLENSIISTKFGDKLIQDIIIGDSVLTHTGEYKEVISTIAYPSREELIKINNSISTKSHEYYVLNKKYIDLVDDENIHHYAEWVKAENLTNEYFLLEYEDNV
jgi:hypothetical protein